MATLFTFGCGMLGELGHSKPEDSAHPTATPVAFPEHVSVGTCEDVQAVALGTDHSVALAGGRVYRWGLFCAHASRPGRSGLTTPSTHDSTENGSSRASSSCSSSSRGDQRLDGSMGYKSGVVPRPLPLEQWGRLEADSDTSEVASVQQLEASVCSVACGGSSTFMLTDTGNVFAFGDLRPPHGDPGCLRQVWRAGLGSPGRAIVQISAGWRHCLLLSQGGEVFTLGDDEHGQCAGLGGGSAPLRMASMHRALGVAAGACHSVAWDAAGAAFAWGHGGSGRLGLGCSRVCRQPAKVDTLREAVCGVACGANFTFFATERGARLWASGGNQYGQLGLGPDASPQDVPARLDWPCPGDAVAALDCGSSHTLCLTRPLQASGPGRPARAVVWAWGCAVGGQCGRVAGEQLLAPAPPCRFTPEPMIDFLAPSPLWPLAVAAGRSHSAVLARLKTPDPPSLPRAVAAAWSPRLESSSSSNASEDHTSSPIGDSAVSVQENPEPEPTPEVPVPMALRPMVSGSDNSSAEAASPQPAGKAEACTPPDSVPDAPQQPVPAPHGEPSQGVVRTAILRGSSSTPTLPTNEWGLEASPVIREQSRPAQGTHRDQLPRHPRGSGGEREEDVIETFCAALPLSWASPARSPSFAALLEMGEEALHSGGPRPEAKRLANGKGRGRLRGQVAQRPSEAPRRAQRERWEPRHPPPVIAKGGAGSTLMKKSSSTGGLLREPETGTGWPRRPQTRGGAPASAAAPRVETLEDVFASFMDSPPPRKELAARREVFERQAPVARQNEERPAARLSLFAPQDQWTGIKAQLSDLTSAIASISSTIAPEPHHGVFEDAAPQHSPPPPSSWDVQPVTQEVPEQEPRRESPWRGAFADMPFPGPPPPTARQKVRHRRPPLRRLLQEDSTDSGEVSDGFAVSLSSGGSSASSRGNRQGRHRRAAPNARPHGGQGAPPSTQVDPLASPRCTTSGRTDAGTQTPPYVTRHEGAPVLATSALSVSPEQPHGVHNQSPQPLPAEVAPREEPQVEVITGDSTGAKTECEAEEQDVHNKPFEVTNHDQGQDADASALPLSERSTGAVQQPTVRRYAIAVAHDSGGPAAAAPAAPAPSPRPPNPTSSTPPPRGSGSNSSSSSGSRSGSQGAGARSLAATAATQQPVIKQPTGAQADATESGSETSSSSSASPAQAPQGAAVMQEATPPRGETTAGLDGSPSSGGSTSSSGVSSPEKEQQAEPIRAIRKLEASDAGSSSGSDDEHEPASLATVGAPALQQEPSGLEAVAVLRTPDSSGESSDSAESSASSSPRRPGIEASAAVRPTAPPSFQRGGAPQISSAVEVESDSDGSSSGSGSSHSFVSARSPVRGPTPTRVETQAGEKRRSDQASGSSSGGSSSEAE